MASRKVISAYTDAQINTALGNLYRKTVAPPLAPGEFTLRLLAKQEGITVAFAKGWVDKRLADKTVISVGLRRDANGREAQAYKVAEK